MLPPPPLCRASPWSPQHRPQLSNGLPSLGCDQAGLTAVPQPQSAGVTPIIQHRALAQRLGCTTEPEITPQGSGGLATATDPPLSQCHGACALAWPEWVAGSDPWDSSQALTWLLEHEQQLQYSRMSKETLRAKSGEGSCPQMDRPWPTSAGRRRCSAATAAPWYPLQGRGRAQQGPAYPGDLHIQNMENLEEYGNAFLFPSMVPGTFCSCCPFPLLQPQDLPIPSFCAKPAPPQAHRRLPELQTQVQVQPVNPKY